MRVRSQYPEQLRDLRHIYLADSAEAVALEPISLRSLRFNKAYALLKLAGSDTRNQAEALRGKLVCCDIDQLPPLEDGEYFLFQLTGMKVVTDGSEIGRIREVLETGANDVYIVDSPDYGELLIPAHDETIEDIDFDIGVVTMSMPEGLLPAK